MFKASYEFIHNHVYSGQVFHLGQARQESSVKLWHVALNTRRHQACRLAVMSQAISPEAMCHLEFASQPAGEVWCEEREREKKKRKGGESVSRLSWQKKYTFLGECEREERNPSHTGLA